MDDIDAIRKMVHDQGGRLSRVEARLDGFDMVMHESHARLDAKIDGVSRHVEGMTSRLDDVYSAANRFDDRLEKHVDQEDKDRREMIRQLKSLIAMVAITFIGWLAVFVISHVVEGRV